MSSSQAALFSVLKGIAGALILASTLCAEIAARDDASSIPVAVENCVDLLKDAQPTEIRVLVGGASTLCYSGQIDVEGAGRFLDALSKLPDGPVDVVVRSLGGDVEFAMDMAEALVSRGYDLYVSSSCGSSCANYLFLPANRRVVLASSFVLFHGGMSPGFEATLREQLQKEKRKRNPDTELIVNLEANIAGFPGSHARERALFEATGIDPDFMEFFDNVFNALPRRRFREHCQDRRTASSVVFSERFLSERGAQIDLDLGPRSAEELTQLWIDRGVDPATMEVCWWE